MYTISPCLSRRIAEATANDYPRGESKFTFTGTFYPFLGRTVSGTLLDGWVRQKSRVQALGGSSLAGLVGLSADIPKRLAGPDGAGPTGFPMQVAGPLSEWVLSRSVPDTSPEKVPNTLDFFAANQHPWVLL
jgi:hypothetical protein